MATRNSSRHRPLFHGVVLAIGFIVGGFMTQFARKFLPVGAVKEFLTTGVTPSVGPLPIDCAISGMRFAPNRRSTTTRMRRISMNPMFPKFISSPRTATAR